MPETFPKSHSAQFNLKYLQVKSNLILSSKTDNTITITALNPFFFSPKQEATLRESTVEGKKKDGGEQILKLKQHNLSLKSSLYF